MSRSAHLQTRLLLSSATALGLLVSAPAFADFDFTAGDLVVSVEGDGGSTGTYTDNQAAPLTLRELSVTGTSSASVVGQLVLPQATTVVNGTTQYAISGEYGSSSEGALQLSGNGEYLSIMGYGVNANAFNANPGAYSAPASGNTALGQSTNSTVARVVGLIGANGSVDTSTALTNVFNENNPRSVYTQDGSSFYVSGQGASKSDTATQGLFYATKGATSATQIDGTTDTRDVQVVNGQLYVSRDYNPPSGHGPATISQISGTGSTLPTSSTSVQTTQLLSNAAGNYASLTLSAASENGVNNKRGVGNSIYLSPEGFFFASSTVLYVADSGSPKNGSAEAAGLGVGGLQKWVYNSTTKSWALDYTLYSGLNLVDNSGKSGVTGLLGLTGEVIGGQVELFATSYTIGDTDTSYLYGITDSLTNTVFPTGESFTTLLTAGADENIKGVSFTPVPEPASIAIFGAGLLGLGFLARRRTRHQLAGLA